jgi:hypothetical protein
MPEDAINGLWIPLVPRDAASVCNLSTIQFFGNRTGEFVLFREQPEDFSYALDLLAGARDEHDSVLMEALALAGQQFLFRLSRG